MKVVIALLALILIGAAQPRAPCSQAGEQYCGIGDRSELQLRGGIESARRVIRIPAAAMPLERPLTVRFAGLASVEFYWNGVLIGRNGVPGEDRASEVPGQYYATFVIPQRLVRPGDNLVEARLSGQHLWLPVERPVHILDVAPYETPQLPGLSDYLPALLALGAIASAFAYFLASTWVGSATGGRLVAAFALAAMLQLIAEVSRAFIAFPYPWALGRVAAIAFLASTAAVLMAAYSAQRFMSRRGPLLVGGTGAVAMASLVLIPWFDFKAIGALLGGAIAVGLASVAGIGRGASGARWAALFSILMIADMIREFTAFLDMGWHLIAAAVLVLLVIEQLGQLRSARTRASQVTGLEERLRKAEAAGEPIVHLKDGSRIHRVAEADILYARAADDYCEVVLTDGRTLLVTTSLSRLQESLPTKFIRVHKSYVVNRGLIRQIDPRPGGGKLVKLDGGASIPVGRRYGAAVTT